MLGSHTSRATVNGIEFMVYRACDAHGSKCLSYWVGGALLDFDKFRKRWENEVASINSFMGIKSVYS